MIIDDDADARLHLSTLLENIDEAQVVAEAQSAEDAVVMLDSMRPDVIFLDVEMPGMDGLEFAHHHCTDAAIVFVTGHARYALEAWETEAVDFLHKPVDEPKLLRALHHASATLRAWSEFHDVEMVNETCDADAPPRIAVSHKSSTRFFEVEDISRFYAMDGFTLFQSGGCEHIVEGTLDALEEQLDRFGFKRAHRGELVNINHVVEISRNTGAGATARLRDGQLAAVSKRHYGPLLASMNLLSSRLKSS